MANVPQSTAGSGATDGPTAEVAAAIALAEKAENEAAAAETAKSAAEAKVAIATSAAESAALAKAAAEQKAAADPGAADEAAKAADDARVADEAKLTAENELALAVETAANARKAADQARSAAEALESEAKAAKEAAATKSVEATIVVAPAAGATAVVVPKEVASRSDVGIQPVGRGATTILAIFFAAFVMFLLYTGFALWPVTSTHTGTEPMTLTCPNGVVVQPDAQFVVPRYYFGVCADIDQDRSVFLVVVIGGALGAVLHVLRSFARYVGERQLKWSWVPRYLLLPFVGAALAAIAFVILRAGLLAGPVSQEGNMFGFATVGIFAGLFSEQVMSKLKVVFETVFTTVEPGTGAIGLPTPTTKGGVLRGAVGDDLAIEGTALEGVTEVIFTGDASSPAVWSEDDHALMTTVPEDAKSGHLRLKRGDATYATTTEFQLTES
jgi:hypothetical protein